MTPRPEPGPVPDEAARLVEAALDWARRSIPESWAEGDCVGCPACRTVRAVRSGSPELAEKLTAAVTDVAVAASGLLRVLAESGHAGRTGHGGRTGEAAPGSTTGTRGPDGDGPGPAVQRIEIT
ncbi:MAG TPA: hypothetical protein VGR21_00260 [Cryptosporangiaceae bacterium]|nr:hypothetical protein [Cryptosporangiaceae bacterium]